MHLGLILLAIGIVGCTRWWFLLGLALRPLVSQACPPASSQTWGDRWQHALVAFLLPPLLLLTTAVAVLCMGTQGQMLGLAVGWLGYSLAIGFLGLAALLLLWSAAQGWRSLRALQTYCQCHMNGMTGRVLADAIPFAAQVGFWRSELVISQGLLDRLNLEQLNAVLTHEQAHAHHRDTFWFFWLGWIRQLTAWLPYTEALWQELLLLRELRADRWAAQRVDPLLLAESLLLVVQAPLTGAQEVCAAFGSNPSFNRLEERIDALLTDATEPEQPQFLAWFGLGFVALLPFLTVLFHT